MSERWGLKGCHPNENNMIESLIILVNHKERLQFLQSINQIDTERGKKAFFYKYTAPLEKARTNNSQQLIQTFQLPVENCIFC